MYRSYYPHRSRELVSPVCGIVCTFLQTVKFSLFHFIFGVETLGCLERCLHCVSTFMWIMCILKTERGRKVIDLLEIYRRYVQVLRYNVFTEILFGLFKLRWCEACNSSKSFPASQISCLEIFRSFLFGKRDAGNHIINK